MIESIRSLSRAFGHILPPYFPFSSAWFRLALQFFQGDTEVIVCLGVVGLEPDRLAVFGDRLLRLPLLAQGVAGLIPGTP